MCIYMYKYMGSRTLVSLNYRLKDHLGPVTRVKQKNKQRNALKSALAHSLRCPGDSQCF